MDEVSLQTVCLVQKNEVLHGGSPEGVSESEGRAQQMVRLNRRRGYGSYGRIQKA
jgi:hypothetical protein